MIRRFVGMNGNLKYLVIVVSSLIGIYLLWYFKTIVIFVLLSSILSLVLHPLFNFFRGNIKCSFFKWIRLSDSWSAFATIVLMWFFIISMVSYIVPFVIDELQFLSQVDSKLMFERVEKLFNSFFPLLKGSIVENVGFPVVKEQFNEFLIAIFDLTKLKEMLASVADFVGNTFMALFSISFITFFLLKDEWLLLEGIKLFVPKLYHVGIEHMLWSITKLLKRYFIGIIIQITLVSILVTGGFLFLGLGLRHSLIIGLFSGFINIIPYLGPMIGALFGYLVSIVVYLQMANPPSLLLFLIGILVVYAIVQLLDNILFQPVIFSSSVKAHPLEIFLVIIMAGYISGIPGMFLAIPVYTIIRVIAKEFFSKYKLVKKLTGKLD